MFGGIAVLLLLCLITAQALAGSGGTKAKLKCGNRFIGGGETYMYVLSVCGIPTMERSVDRGKNTTALYVKGQKHYYLTFHSDRLQSVRMKIIR